jgi:hypothetical protein
MLILGLTSCQNHKTESTATWKSSDWVGTYMYQELPTIKRLYLQFRHQIKISSSKTIVSLMEDSTILLHPINHPQPQLIFEGYWKVDNGLFLSWKDKAFTFDGKPTEVPFYLESEQLLLIPGRFYLDEENTKISP